MTNTRAQRTKKREKLKKRTHKRVNTTTTRTTAKQYRDDIPDTTAQNSTTQPASRINNIPGAKVYDLNMVAKHPPEPSTMAAKHPPDNQRDDGGKASAVRQTGFSTLN